MTFAILLILGLLTGSFLSAFTYRLPRKMGFVKGRSFCDSCRKHIKWYDNIPLLSYILLRGKCRFCKKKISIRYPLLEASCAAIFIAIWFVLNYHDKFIYSEDFIQGSVVYWQSLLGNFVLPFSIIIISILISVFIIDLEEKIIPDSLVFFGSLIVGIALLLSQSNLYVQILSGFVSSLFFLLIHFATKGKGMGLGDVKLAFLGGLLLGPIQSMVFIFFAFLTGAIIGLILIFEGKSKFGKQIAFGPFMVVGMLAAYLFGPMLVFGYISLF